jgi:hypothetical protein
VEKAAEVAAIVANPAEAAVHPVADSNKGETKIP